MNVVILDTVEDKYLAYDGQTDVVLWVVGIQDAHEFHNQTDLNIALALLYTEAEPDRFVGRPGDRGGSH